MLKHLLIKHSLAKTMLIVALHASVTFDAWTTVRVQNEPFPARTHAVEDDPLMRPFAKGPAMYPAINLLPLPLDLAILRARSRRAKMIVYTLAMAAITAEIVTSKRNMNLYDQTAVQYHQQFVCSGCRVEK
jgi:hypothetical protein